MQQKHAPHAAHLRLPRLPQAQLHPSPPRAPAPRMLSRQQTLMLVLLRLLLLRPELPVADSPGHPEASLAMTPSGLSPLTIAVNIYRPLPHVTVQCSVHGMQSKAKQSKEAKQSKAKQSKTKKQNKKQKTKKQKQKKQKTKNKKKNKQRAQGRPTHNWSSARMMNPEFNGMRPTILLLREGTDESQVRRQLSAVAHVFAPPRLARPIAAGL